MASKTSSAGSRGEASAEKSRLAATVLLAAFLAALFAGSVVSRVHVSQSLERFNPEDDTAFYWTEAAVQYRYARMIAQGEPIPELDRMLQYPEGVEVFQNLTVLMEYAAGYGYRAARVFFPELPLHVFLILFSSVFSSLSVLAIYLLARVLFESRIAGVVASLIYAFSTPGAGRAVGAFGREDFALPLIFWSLCLYVLAGREGTGRDKRRIAAAVGSALCLAAALAAWHFTRFYFLLFVLVCVAGFVLVNQQEDTARRSRALFLIAVVAAALAGVLVPVLREKRFIASPPMLLAAALVIAGWAAARIGRRGRSGAALRLGLLLALGVPAVWIGVSLGAESEGYSHVYALLVEKIRFLGVKPADPGDLPFAARVLWVEAFNSPSLYFVAVSFWALIPFCAAGAVRLGLGGPFMARDPMRFLVLGLTVCFGILFLFVQRLSVFAAFFLAVIGGGIAWNLRPRWRAVALGVTIPVAAVLVSQFVQMQRTTPFRAAIRGLVGYEDPVTVHNWQLNDLDAVRWIRQNTDPAGVFLSRFGAGPMILAYADRAIVLQPKFEARGIRDKVREFLESLYSDEEALYAFCKMVGANYYLFDIRSALDVSPDGDRYTGDALKLPTSSAAFLLQFAPERLGRFRLVYQNSFYRLFRVVEGPADNDPARFPFQPIYDIRAFGGQSLDAPFFDDAHTQGVIRALDRAVDLFKTGRLLFQAGRMPEAAARFKSALDLHPTLVGAHTYLGMSQALSGDVEAGIQNCLIETEIAPDLPLAFYNLGYTLYLARRYDGALEAWRRTLSLDPGYPKVAESIRSLEEFLEKRDTARSE